MLIKLQPTQIQHYWESIKFSAIKADMIEEKDILPYSVQLLLDLLNGNVQCIMAINEKNEIKQILLIEFIYNEIYKKKYMVFKTLYSFTHNTDQDWVESADKVYRYAKKEKCNAILMTSANPLAIKVAEICNMKEQSKNYILNL